MGDTGPFDVACRHRVVKISGCNEGLTVMIECGIDFEEKICTVQCAASGQSTSLVECFLV